MKILQMSRWFFPHVGGGSIRVYQVAKTLTQMGHEVHLLTHNPKSIGQCNLDEEAPLYEKHPDGFFVHRLPYYKLGKSFNWAISIPLMSRNAVEIIKKEEIDVILSHNPPYLVGTASLSASKLTGKPVVTLIHDVWGASHYSPLQYTIGNFLQRRCIKRSKRVVTASEGLKNIIAKEFNFPKEKIFVSPTGIDLKFSEIDQSRLKEVLKKYAKLGVRPDGKYIFFVGILRKWAGVPQLIDAFAGLSKDKRYAKFKLLLVGGGDKAEFEKRAEKLGIKERVIFTDAVPYADVPYLISLATITCAPFPSTSVTDQDKLMSPHKVLEYMVVGKPIVASAVGGMETYIKDNITGVLYKPDDITDLKDKIVYLLENPKLREGLSKNAYEYVRKGGFEWKDSVRSVEKALLEAIKNG